ncbi:MAG TPA: HAD-IIIC family phosphatase [Terriglobales bacterium]|nr:HAD-IIIC family phosphatase [Terriglobales bacterium]
MYETEVNHKVESGAQLPADVISALEELKGRVVARTVLPWSEHCTECVWPTCYTSCDLYSPREDGRCRRFVDGMVRVETSAAFSSYLLKIRFKRWGKLWSPGSVRLFSADKAQQIENRDRRIGSVLYQIALPSKIKRTLSGKRYSFKKRMAQQPGNGEMPTSFMLECYNPGAHAVRLSLTMRAVDENVRIPFQKLIELTPGFHRTQISMEEIRGVLDVQLPFNIEIIPNDESRETTLYFGLMEFVREIPKKIKNIEKPEKAKKIKCVVWDLDNTMWDGTLVEDGIAKLKLKPEIIDVIRRLDDRGILHSIASKNNAEEALQVLKNFGIDEYFLCPQISWQPKSEAIRAIAAQLNIGIDTLLFVDDSKFELEQVQAAHPDLRVLSAEKYLTISEMNECQVPVTSESRERRKMYQVENKRQDLAQNFGDDYMAFLKHCDIRLNLQAMTEANIERVHELTQRTNQMNFSGNRYDRDVLRKILQTGYLDTFVIECEDRFGSYGTVGFCIVDKREPRMTDLMFSCRIQSKRVEHAFLSYIIRKYITECGKDFHANYRKTSRNAPSGRVFDDLGLQESGIEDGVSLLLFPQKRVVPDDGIIHISLNRNPLVLA